MKYKYFTWIRDVLQELPCLSSIQKKRAESTGKRRVYGLKKQFTGNREWYNEMRCGRDCYSNSTERRTVQEKTIMDLKQNLCLIFSFLCFQHIGQQSLGRVRYQQLVRPQ